LTAPLQYVEELKRRLLWLIVVRAGVLFAGLNLAGSLGILPASLFGCRYLPLFNLATAGITLGYLFLWKIQSHRSIELYLQIGIDLIITTILVATTNGIESPFVSFYLLIITFCSITLGRNGGLVGAALSTILYAAVIAAGRLGMAAFDGMNSSLATFRISAHVVGFIGVAMLGTHLSRRLGAVQLELAEKTDSLRQLKRRNEHIIRSIRSGLITTDLMGDIAVFNNAAEEITGKTSASIIGQPLPAILGESLWQKITTADLSRDAKALRHEDWIAVPDDKPRFLGFSVSPLEDQEHQLLGYIVSFQDLTEIKRLEEEVRRKDRMADIGRMAAAIAHEIRNPLTSMQGSVEILRSHANLPKSDERLLEILIRESDRLNRFVEDFLGFAHPGRCALHSLDLAPLIRDSVTLLKNSPEVRERHTVRLILECNEIRILGDRNRLQQVFWNLSQNAVRAMTGGGTLTIIARKTPEQSAQILFQDSGIGMTQEEMDQLFQPFNSGFGIGSGLGLSIVSQIMEDHRGKISFESEKGRGTEVVLSFPPELQVGDNLVRTGS
jgi:two-component system sensor histidine kinase PilS (NtrC family)